MANSGSVAAGFARRFYSIETNDSYIYDISELDRHVLLNFYNPGGGPWRCWHRWNCLF